MIALSEFDELFNSIQTSNIVDIIRDSRIELVSEFDEPPLKTGEYFYDDKTNTLYVGAGQLMNNDRFNFSHFIRTKSSYVYKPAPRVASFMVVDLDLKVTFDSAHKGTMHYYIESENVVVPAIVTYSTEAHRQFAVHTFPVEHNVDIAIITHESEVNKIYGE